MMKWTFLLILSLLSFSSFAADTFTSCQQALPTNNANFCSSFHAVASCHCVESGLPQKTCQNMNTIYQLMLARFGSIDKACEYQHDTSTQICKDDWSCYRLGGSDSQGRLCSSTGKICSV